MSHHPQHLIVPVVQEMGPVDTWGLLRRRKRYMDEEKILNEAIANCLGFPPGYYGGSHVAPTRSDNNFVVHVDVSHFTPGEVKVRLVGRDLIIDGEHEERRDDHGYISRSFCRRYSLPEDVDEQNVACELSGDGKRLKLEVPKKIAIVYTPQERMIAIQNEAAEGTTVSDTKKVESAGADSKRG